MVDFPVRYVVAKGYYDQWNALVVLNDLLVFGSSKLFIPKLLGLCHDWNHAILTYILYAYMYHTVSYVVSHVRKHVCSSMRCRMFNLSLAFTVEVLFSSAVECVKLRSVRKCICNRERVLLQQCFLIWRRSVDQER